MKKIAGLLLMLLVVSCDRETETPASPSPATTTTVPAATPRALLQPVGTFTFDRCTFVQPSFCAFNGTLLNNGSGCAIRVEGTVRLFDRTGDLQLGGAFKFNLPSQQIVQPGQTVAYSISFVPFDSAIRTATYLADFNWIDTSCR